MISNLCHRSIIFLVSILCGFCSSALSAPDLIISTLNVVSPAVRPTNPFRIDVTITNQGDSDASPIRHRLMIRLSTDSTYDDTDYLLASLEVAQLLSPQEPWIRNLTPAVPTGGSYPQGWYYIVAKTDATNMVAESVETNNTDAVQVKIEDDVFYTVDGYVKYQSGGGMSGVTVTLTGRPSVTTQSNGYYHFDNVSNGTYTATPSIEGYAFTPASRGVTVAGSDVELDDFVGIRVDHSVSGYVKSSSSGNGMGAVIVSLTGNSQNKTASTQSNGYFHIDNVWEWCSDWNSLYSSTTVYDPVGPSTGTSRVYRGGCWSSNNWVCRSACRDGGEPNLSNDKCGFRLVQQDPPEPGEQAMFAGIDFVWCPPGSFTMGAPIKGDEEPGHVVTFSQGFWMSKYEITQAQWTAVMGSNPSQFREDSRPVENMSWNDIVDPEGYLEKLNAANPGLGFRLPSESEWEYACRAGTTAPYYWGDEASNEYGWYDGNSDVAGVKQTHTAGGKLPNAWGLYDMSGNVWEWVQDRYHATYNGAPTDGTAWLSEEGALDANRVLRGGGFPSVLESMRSANRDFDLPSNVEPSHGFRIVRR